MRQGALAILLISLASASVAQPIPGGQGKPEQPRSSNSGGFGGIGVSIKLGGKKKPKALPPEPPLEMRDKDIPNALSDQVIFVIQGPALQGPVPNADRIARTAKVTIIETTYLDQSDLTMLVAQLSPGDDVAAAVARLEKQKGVAWAQPNQQFQLLGSKPPKRFALHAIPEKQPRVSGKIVMIDAPVDTGHDNLKGASVQQSFFGVSEAPQMHGTAVAALLVGTGPFPGTAQGADLTSLAAFGSAASGASLSRTSYLAKAMNQAARLRPDVLNLSFGGPEDRLLGVTLDAIHKNGVCVAAAAGNGGPKGSCALPGNPSCQPSRHRR